jgi:hypothetical protein
MSYEQHLLESDLGIPALPPQAAACVPALRSSSLVFASGQTPTVDTKLGSAKLGAGVSVGLGPLPTPNRTSPRSVGFSARLIRWSAS